MIPQDLLPQLPGLRIRDIAITPDGPRGPRRVVQRLAQQAIDQRVPLRELLAADPAGAALDLGAIFDYGVFVRHADEIIARLDAIAAPSPRVHAAVE